MATKWAVANGNWTSGSTWNDGVVPASNDIVYCNGHTIAMTWTTIMVGELRNDANSELGIIAGGYLQLPASHGTFNFVGNIYANGTILTTLNTALRQDIINITGNIHNSDSNFYAIIGYDTNASRNSLNINGNLYGNYCASLFYSGILVVNGTLYPTDDTLPMIGVGTYGERAGGAIINSSVNDITVVASGNATINQLQINGNAFEENNRMVYGSNISVITYFTINGDYTNKRARYYNVTNFTIGGSIYYVGTNNKLGVNYTNITILNPNTFVWKDIAEPRSNPFIILTDAEMNNHQQYPSEDEVKEGTEYVWGEKVGTYQQPPESVVLSGYEYDTITAEENDIATYNVTRYIYADYGTLHWFELKTTTTDIVTTPSQQSITIDGDTVVVDTDYVVEYNDVCYQWSGSAWGSITTKNIGTVKTDIVINPTETTLGVKKGILVTTNLSQQLISRLENCATIETVQQLLVAHLDD